MPEFNSSYAEERQQIRLNLCPEVFLIIFISLTVTSFVIQWVTSSLSIQLRVMKNVKDTFGDMFEDNNRSYK